MIMILIRLCSVRSSTTTVETNLSKAITITITTMVETNLPKAALSQNAKKLQVVPDQKRSQILTKRGVKYQQSTLSNADRDIHLGNSHGSFSQSCLIKASGGSEYCRFTLIIDDDSVVWIGWLAKMKMVKSRLSCWWWWWFNHIDIQMMIRSNLWARGKSWERHRGLPRGGKLSEFLQQIINIIVNIIFIINSIVSINIIVINNIVINIIFIIELTVSVESTLSISLFTFVSLSVLTQQLFKFAFFLKISVVSIFSWKYPSSIFFSNFLNVSYHCPPTSSLLLSDWD